MKSFVVAALTSLAIAANRQADQVDNCEAGIKVTHNDFYGHDVNPLPDWTLVEPFKDEVVNTINIDSTYDDFYSSRHNSSLGAIFEGYVVIPEAGEWTFGTISDDGTLLYIGSEQIIDNSGGHGMRERTGVKSLDAGKHAIKIEFQQGGGPYGIQIKYGGPGTAYDIIPADRFVHNCSPKKVVSVTQWTDTMDWSSSFQSVLGDIQWVDFRQLIDNEVSRETLATDISDELFAQFLADKGTLPDVCEAGQACRDAIWADAKLQLQHEWIDVLTRVNQKLNDSFLESRVLLESSFKDEFLCDDGCYCEEIEGTYTDHILIQREIEKDILDLQTDIKVLYDKQSEVLVTCPDYSETALDVPAEYQ
jgi:hypothetical protein